MIESVWSVFEPFVTIVEAFIIMRFVCISLNADLKIMKDRVVFVTGSIILSIIVIIMNSITLYEGLLGFIYPVFIFVYSLMFLNGNNLKKMFIAVGSVLCVLAINALTLIIIARTVNSSIEDIYVYQDFIRFIGIAVSKILLIYIFNIVLKITRKGDVILSKREWLLIILIFIVSFASIAITHFTLLNMEVTTSQSVLLSSVKVGLVVINIVCFYMIINLSKSRKALTENILLKQQNDFQKNYADSVKQQYEEICRLKHDMKHSYTLITTLAHEEKYGELRDYLQKYSNDIQNTEVMINTDNEYVNAIINIKLKTAKSKGINILCATVKDFSGINDVDLCNLISNILDNAIESCEKCAEPNIEISISSNDDKILINVKNSIMDSPFNKKGELVTSKHTNKKEQEYHGYGIKTIKRIAEDYSGKADFYEEDDMFCCYVEISRTDNC